MSSFALSLPVILMKKGKHVIWSFNQPGPGFLCGGIILFPVLCCNSLWKNSPVIRRGVLMRMGWLSGASVTSFNEDRIQLAKTKGTWEKHSITTAHFYIIFRDCSSYLHIILVDNNVKLILNKEVTELDKQNFLFVSFLTFYYFLLLLLKPSPHKFLFSKTFLCVPFPFFSLSFNSGPNVFA